MYSNINVLGVKKRHTFPSARPQISAGRMAKFLRVTPCAATHRGATRRKDFGDAALGPESLGRPLAGLAAHTRTVALAGQGTAIFENRRTGGLPTADIEAFEAANLHANTVGPIRESPEEDRSNAIAETISNRLVGHKVGGGWAASCTAREKRDGRAE
jgi:hypothetical protein